MLANVPRTCEAKRARCRYGLAVLRVSGCAILLGAALIFALPASAGKDPALLRAQAFVDKRCPAQYREISARMWFPGLRFNALYGNCRAGDGRDQRIWFFDRGRFIGTDARKSSHLIIGVWRDDKTIAFLYVLYRQTDAECCPTGGGASVRFRWTGRGFARLDPLPPRAFTPGVVVGR